MAIKQLKKAISVLVIITFLFSNIAYGEPSSRQLFKGKKVDQQKLSDQKEETLKKTKSVIKGEETSVSSQPSRQMSQRILSSHLEDLSQIHIPAELGSVIEVYQAPKNPSTNSQPPLIVNIQDLHTNPEGQLNLANILEILLRDYNMGVICSEGADGKVDTSSVSSFPDKEVREKTAKLFINSGELTGEEYLSITKYPDLSIWGIEDKDVYFKNIAEFNDIMKYNPESELFISQIKKALEALKPKIYSKEILNLDQKEADYEAQNIKTDAYLKDISSYIQKLNIPTDDYPNIAILNETIQAEKKIDQQKIMQDTQNLLLNLQTAIQARNIRSDLDSLMAKAQLFKDEKISPFSFYSYLKDLAQKHLKDQMSKYQDLNEFIGYLTKVNSLDSTKLFIEMEALTFDIKQRLAKRDEEKTLTQALRNIKFLEGFFDLKISNDELKYYLQNKDSHKVAFFEAFLKPAINKYNINASIDFNPDLIDSKLQQLEEFYQTVKSRDGIMFNNTIAQVEKRNSKVTALVTGGFHTKGITSLLREKGYSYIVVAPFAKSQIDEENYHFLLSGKRKPVEDLIKQLDTSEELTKKPSQNKLRVPVGDTLTLRRIKKAIEEVSGSETVKNKSSSKKKENLSKRRSIDKALLNLPSLDFAKVKLDAQKRLAITLKDVVVIEDKNAAAEAIIEYLITRSGARIHDLRDMEFSIGKSWEGATDRELIPLDIKSPEFSRKVVIKDSKRMNPDSEFDDSKLASDLKLGPDFIYSETGKLNVHLDSMIEEYLEPVKRLSREDELLVGRKLAEKMYIMLDTSGKETVTHAFDNLSSHLYIVRKAGDIDVRFIDWGRVTYVSPNDRLRFSESHIRRIIEEIHSLSRTGALNNPEVALAGFISRLKEIALQNSQKERIFYDDILDEAYNNLTTDALQHNPLKGEFQELYQKANPLIGEIDSRLSAFSATGIATRRAVKAVKAGLEKGWTIANHILVSFHSAFILGVLVLPSVIRGDVLNTLFLSPETLISIGFLWASYHTGVAVHEMGHYVTSAKVGALNDKLLPEAEKMLQKSLLKRLVWYAKMFIEIPYGKFTGVIRTGLSYHPDAEYNLAQTAAGPRWSRNMAFIMLPVAVILGAIGLVGGNILAVYASRFTFGIGAVGFLDFKLADPGEYKKFQERESLAASRADEAKKKSEKVGRWIDRVAEVKKRMMETRPQEIMTKDGMLIRAPWQFRNCGMGGVHTEKQYPNSNISMQETMFNPLSPKNYGDMQEMTMRLQTRLQEIIEAAEGCRVMGIGLEGGLAPYITKEPGDIVPEQRLWRMAKQAILDCGYVPGMDVAIALDPACSELENAYRKENNDPNAKGMYLFWRDKEKITMTRDELFEFFRKTIEENDIPIVSIEDGFAEDDDAGWKLIKQGLGDKLFIIGDDSVTTRDSSIEYAADNDLNNTFLCKANQIGTLSETLLAILVALGKGLDIVVSHRSKSPNDDMEAQIALACFATGLKTGGGANTERLMKYGSVMRVMAEAVREAQGFVAEMAPTEREAMLESEKIAGDLIDRLVITEVVGWEEATNAGIPTVKVRISFGIEGSSKFKKLFVYEGSTPLGTSAGTGEAIHLVDSVIYESQIPDSAEYKGLFTQKEDGSFRFKKEVTKGQIEAFGDDALTELFRRAQRYDGKGCLNAVDHVNTALAENFRGLRLKDLGDLVDVDRKLLALEMQLSSERGELKEGATEDEKIAIMQRKGNIGMNAILSQSLAGARLLANLQGKELYVSLREKLTETMAKTIAGNGGLDILPDEIKKKISVREGQELWEALNEHLDFFELKHGLQIVNKNKSKDVKLYELLREQLPVYKPVKAKEKTRTTALKDIGDEDAVSVSAMAFEALKAQAQDKEVSTKDIKGSIITAKFIVDTGKNMPKGMSAFHFYDKDKNLVIVTQEETVSGSGSIAEEAAYHEAVEASRIKELASDLRMMQTEREHVAHILAAAEEVIAFGKQGLTPYHKKQLSEMPSDKLKRLINENREGYYSLMGKYLSANDVNKIRRYEENLKKEASAIIARSSNEAAGLADTLENEAKNLVYTLNKKVLDGSYNSEELATRDLEEQFIGRIIKLKGIKEEVPILIEIAKSDRNSIVRAAFIRALGEIGAREARNGLLDIWRDEPKESTIVRKALVKAFPGIGLSEKEISLALELEDDLTHRLYPEVTNRAKESLLRLYSPIPAGIQSGVEVAIEGDYALSDVLSNEQDRKEKVNSSAIQMLENSFVVYRGADLDSDKGDVVSAQKERIENIIEATNGLEPLIVPGICLINIYESLKTNNIFWSQAAANAPPLISQPILNDHKGAILLVAPSLENISDLTLARNIIIDQIQLTVKQKALEQELVWTEDLAELVRQKAVEYVDKKAVPFWKIRDAIQERAVKLNYILNEEIGLIPDLPDYPSLPKVKQPIVFNAKKNIKSDVMSIILNNTELGNVVFGLKPASIVNIKLSGQELFDLRYALLIFKHMRGPGMQILPLSDGRFYVYDEDYLRSKASEDEAKIATTRLGLGDLLIRKDVASGKGKYFELARQAVSPGLQRVQNELTNNIIKKEKKPYFINHLEIGALFMPTYERPDALDRALNAQTTCLKTFGLEYLPIIVADSSIDRPKEINGKKVDFVEENLKIINKYRAKGFSVQYISSEEIEAWKQGVLDKLYSDYSDKLKAGELDPSIQRELVKEGVIDKEKLKEILYASLNIGNIAGKRTVIQVMTQGKKIASADDDALPITRIPNINSLKDIFARRDARVKDAKITLYKELSDIFSSNKNTDYSKIKINDDADFERILASMDSFPIGLQDELAKALNKAYAYSEDGSTGAIPIAAEQIIKTIPKNAGNKDDGAERRLRFDRILHQDLPEYLVVSEDTGVDTYKNLPDIDNTNAYDWVPVDYLRVFDETLGSMVGSPIAGRIFDRDLRGTAGSVATSMEAKRNNKKILLATSHFSGDRDNSAQGILREAMSKFYRDMVAGKPLDTKYLQQVVRKAIFVEVNSSVSTKMNVGNQFCFNTTSLDNTEFPIPTTGAWLRIEEPLQHTLIMFVMGGAMAWSRTVGGHERCPGSRRPKIEMQDLWEECAMVLYRELQNIFNTLNTELEGENDPAVRIRKLGEAYLASAVKYTMPEIEKENLKETCKRVAEQANTLYAWSEHAQGEDQQELRSIFGLLDSAPFGYIKQFSLAVHDFKVNEDGHTAVCTRYEPVWQHKWEPARLVESYEWKKSEPETIDLGDVDWDNDPVIRLKDGTELHPVSYKEIPRPKPTAGSSFMVAMADGERQKDLITKAQEVIQKQFTWDGQQLLLWPDILKSAAGFDKFHEAWINEHPYTYAQFKYDLEKTAVLIPAAGTGSRLWPLSRKESPKQFCSFDGTGKTMIQRTVERAAGLIPYDRIFISTTPQLEKLAREQLPELPAENIIVMPLTNEVRETSVGIGNAAVNMKKILERKGITSATMAVLPSDQEITNDKGFTDCLKEAISVAQQSAKKYITTLGIKPTSNATGYGYILTEQNTMDGGYVNARSGLGFREKPPYAVRPLYAASGSIPSDSVAKELIDKGAVWNGGMFIVGIDNLLGAFEEYAPSIHEGLIKISDALGTPLESQIAENIFNSPAFVKAKSIDYEIMEKLDRDSNYQLATITAGNIGWDDIGSWIAAVKSGKKDASGNIISGEGAVHANNCKNCIFYTAKGETIETSDLENVIVVTLPDASIVMDISREQDVKLIVKELQKDAVFTSFVEKGLVTEPANKKVIIDSENTNVSVTHGVVGVVGVKDILINKDSGIIKVSKAGEIDIKVIELLDNSVSLDEVGPILDIILKSENAISKCN